MPITCTNIPVLAINILEVISVYLIHTNNVTFVINQRADSRTVYKIFCLNKPLYEGILPVWHIFILVSPRLAFKKMCILVRHLVHTIIKFIFLVRCWTRLIIASFGWPCSYVSTDRVLCVIRRCDSSSWGIKYFPSYNTV